LGIGSFTYLRRVLEKVVDEIAIQKYGKEPSWELETWKKSKKRFEYILDDLSEMLPDFLRGKKVLYEILSKGIHELNENECIEHFIEVRDAIEEILDDKMQQEQKQDRRNKLDGKLTEVKSKIETKTSNS